MYNEGFEQWTKLNKNLTGPAMEFTKTSSEIMRRMTQQHLEMLSENFGKFSDQLKRLSNVRKPDEFFNVQRECFNENITLGLENFNKLCHMYMSGWEECAKIFAPNRENTRQNTEKTAEKIR